MKEAYLRSKCDEYFKIIEKEKSIIYRNDKRKFDSGGYINTFWSANKKFIYNEICKLENKVKYPNAYEVLNNWYLYGAYYLTDEQKFHIFAQKIEELGYIIPKDTDLKFIDGRKYSTFMILHYNEIINFCLSKKDKYPKAHQIVYDYINNQNAFLKKCKEFFEIIEQENKMISSTDKRLFKNNEKVRYFWFKNYEKIYNTISSDEYKNNYPKAYQIIQKVYLNKMDKKKEKDLISMDNSVKIDTYEKIKSLLLFMETKGRKVSIYDKDVFIDGKRYFYFWNYHRKDIINYIKLEKNKNMYPKTYSLLISIYKRKTLTFDRRLKEFISIINREKNISFLYDKSICFSDNTKLYIFWRNHYHEIYNRVVEMEKNGDQSIACRLIQDAYNKRTYKLDKRIMKYIELVEENKSLLTNNRSLKFDDNSLVMCFWSYYKDKIILKFCDENIREKYPNACIILQRAYYYEQFLKIRLIEYFNLVEKYQLLLSGSDLKFSDNTTVANFLNIHRSYIEEEIKKKYYRTKYPIAYSLIMDSMLKRKSKVKIKK